MRKHILAQGTDAPSPPAQGWLDLERLAQVELTSEDPTHPVEAALVAGAGDQGWRAAQPGPQTIRLLFDHPLELRQIVVLFREELRPRTQEFVLRWRREGEARFRDIVRQQYHFSPPGTAEEREAYHVELAGARALELHIVPDIDSSEAHATLAELRLA
jgi:hypothetical protein